MNHTILPEVSPIIITNPKKGKKTIVIVGVGRSCTSLIAGIIDALGINMDGSYDGHFERIHFKNNDWTKNTIDDLNNTYSSWGVQLTAQPETTLNVCRRLRNPHIIIVFRDPIANAQRLELSEAINDPVSYVLEMHEKLLDVSKLGFPCMLVSCERLRYQPKQIIKDICNFIQITPSNYKIRKAISRIGKNGGYLIQK